MPVRRNPPDFIIFLVVLVLLSIGTVMVFSASKYPALVNMGDAFHYLKRQLIYVFLGIIAMFVAMGVDYKVYKRWSFPTLLAALVCLVLVLVVGEESHDAVRWIRIGPVTFQPSEFVKLSIIIFTAYGLSIRRDKILSLTHGMLPYLVITGLAAGLILLQPDLGTAISLAGTVFIMLFAAGAKTSNLASLGLLASAGVAALIYREPYRMKRFLAFLDPWADPRDTGFHIIQSLYALGSGGLFGLGLGQSRQQFLYLPESHTDFVFAILAEETGFIGGSLVILLYILLVWRGLRIALTTSDPFASLLATGITAGIGLQAVINIGVVTGSMPVTGVTLPLVSFGGTSLLFTMVGIGILLNISKHATMR
ncbi:MAG TPA: putative lipid II flippase FtsW [Clostridia bacterium]|nr:putative lipid II flippase FtsW [Clostridia bacterium]